MATSTVEDYVKQLYLEELTEEGGVVAMGQLASAMGVVPGTATTMVKALADSGLVDYEPRMGVKLTAHGRRLALHVLRRHRLLELFLVQVLELDWSAVHEEADALEHAVSDVVLKRMDEYLGHPETDPHGDPIPNSRGKVREGSGVSLADCEVGERVTVARVLDQSTRFLRFVDRQGLKPGCAVTVKECEEGAEAVRIKIKGGGEVSLGLAAAEKIEVEALGS